MTEHKRPKIRDAYSKRVRVYAKTKGESLTHQSFKDECDIHNILKKYQNGEHVQTDQRSPLYDEAPTMDLHTALNLSRQVAQAYVEETSPEERSNYGENYFAWLADRLSPKMEATPEDQVNGANNKASAPDPVSVETDPVPPSPSAD